MKGVIHIALLAYGLFRMLGSIFLWVYGLPDLKFRDTTYTVQTQVYRTNQGFSDISDVGIDKMKSQLHVYHVLTLSGESTACRRVRTERARAALQLKRLRTKLQRHSEPAIVVPDTREEEVIQSKFFTEKWKRS